MTLPQSYFAVIIMMVFSMLCWGSWACTFKAAKFRFELYYFDFAFGVVLMALILAFTFGTLGYDGFTFLDDFLHAGKRAWLYAFLSGVVFNLGAMLLLAAISVAGMAIAYPISAGLSLIIAVVLSRFVSASGNPLMLFGGCLVVLVSMILAAAVYRFINEIRHEAYAKTGKAKSTRRPVAVKGVVLALLSGIVMAGFYPLLALARRGEEGLGPYAVSALMALGLFLTALVFNLFFMNLPIEGEPVDFMGYFRGTPRQHGWGLFGGAIWVLGLVGILTAESADAVRVPSAIGFALVQGPSLIAILWGLLVWKELRDGDAKTNGLVWLMAILYLVGVVATAFGHQPPVHAY